MKSEVEKDIAHYFEKKIGVNLMATGKNFDRVLKSRMAACKISDMLTYYQKILVTPEEEQEFIEALVIPETWFFREKGGFDFLLDYVRAEWSIVGINRVLKILSLPSSTGEEPYSIVMTLLEAGLNPNFFDVDAVDISRCSIEKAKKGIFRKNSFRGNDFGIKEKYFKKIDDKYEILHSIRDKVHFFYGNIADPSFMRGSQVYDFIFCRNILIYLNKKAQKHLLQILNRLMDDNSILITGPAEADIFRSAGYISLKFPMACAFKKAEQMPVDMTFLKSNIGHQSEAEVINNNIQLSENEKKINEQVQLEKVAWLADSGKLNEAMELGTMYIAEHSNDAKGYFLLGLLQHANGNETIAEDYLQKTIYLDPNHYEALVYLALLAEKRGNKDLADIFRIRAKKAMKPVAAKER